MSANFLSRPTLRQSACFPQRSPLAFSGRPSVIFDTDVTTGRLSNQAIRK